MEVRVAAPVRDPTRINQKLPLPRAVIGADGCPLEEELEQECSMENGH